MTIEKKNIFLSNTAEPLPYTSRPAFFEERIPPRANPVNHANFLKRKFEEAYAQNIELSRRQVAAIKQKEGIYLEFSGAENHELVVKSLENTRTGIRLLNVRTEEATGIVKATVYVPEGKEAHFIKKVDQYLNDKTAAGEPRHKNLINSIEDVALAFLEAFWFGKRRDIPGISPVWCEIWLRADHNQYETVETLFMEACDVLSIQLDESSLYFPERIVRLVRANAAQLLELIKGFAFLAEIRRAPEVANFFEELSTSEQREWAEDLLMRLDYEFTSASVCILDTGVNAGHPLLEAAFENDSLHAVESSWGQGDHLGHGTEMAGVSLYDDLQEKLLSEKRYAIMHHLESVKILPPKGENHPELYGHITQQAVYAAEISHPEYDRVTCMAVTSDRYNTSDGSPSSWSGAVDALAYGVNDKKKRLLFVSAGNTYPKEFEVSAYPEANQLHSVENPGQAWNAVTIGAYNQSIHIEDPLFDDYQAVADKGELSPFSSTSLLWDKKWPIKPEILCNGGNMATDGAIFSECADLSLLTTRAKLSQGLFTTISGTSAATAQASWMAARLFAEYPNVWPETARALLVHSAEWTNEMKKQFCGDMKKSSGRRTLLRTCGYGIPSLDRAIGCKNNRVNLIIEGELQPYNKDGMNEMHVHKLPWPEDVLLDLGETSAKIKVTLSYFVEPGPGEIGWKDKYRYPSCNLRFDINNHNENKEDFKKRINRKMREEPTDSGDGDSGSKYWFLGSENRDVGSIHSDFREQTAAELCKSNYVAVYPVIGWWRERKHLKCYNNKLRYSLIVSISTPETGVDLYTPIATQVRLSQKIPVEIQTR